jgi:hypothetical protein
MKIAKLDLNQLNKQLERIEDLHNRLSIAEKQLQTTSFQVSQLDFMHARPTFNNLTFTWTGATGTVSWLNGFLKDKNAAIETGVAFSQAPSYRFQVNHPLGLTHNISIPAGSLTGLSANTYYWLGWDNNNRQMYALTDITKLFTHHDMQIVCQIFTGTVGQTGTVGGGGSQGGTDLSGARYKLF